ncbi:uncharacterized protein LOC113337464 [Papaver somniferum]|uniref:uncharacterized protein LOC113337464 n=1 Tax=Papaver somniferum TaxID=3469 RepID=UPI000E701930|nr:uncharacterized protein LOC113337464 [Papaver somniferum]
MKLMWMWKVIQGITISYLCYFQKVLMWMFRMPNLVLYDTFTPLHSSMYVQSWQCAEALLKACADPNGGSDGTRALPVAAVMGVVKIIRLVQIHMLQIYTD